MEDTIKVKDLISNLKSQNPEAHIILQKDPEGNGFSPVYMAVKSKCCIVECEITGIYCDAGPDMRSSPIKAYKYPGKNVVVDNDDAIILMPFI